MKLKKVNITLKINENKKGEHNPIVPYGQLEVHGEVRGATS